MLTSLVRTNRHSAVTVVLILFIGSVGPVAGAEPFPADVIRLVNDASGLADERFVFGVTFSNEQFREVDALLRASKFRPQRVRPYVTTAGLRIAALWLPGTQGCDVSLDQGRQLLIDEVNRRSREGFALIDLCGYPATAEKAGTMAHAAVWRKAEGDLAGTKFLTEVAEKEINAAIDKLAEEGMVPETIQPYLGPKGELTFDVVCRPGKVGWNYRWAMIADYEYSLEERREDSIQTDIALFFREGYFSRESHEASLKFWTEKTKESPEEAYLRFYCGFNAFMLSRDDDADRELSACLVKQNNYAEARGYRAVVRMRLKRIEDAERDWKEYLELKPSPEQVVFFRTLFRAAGDDAAGAMTALLTDVKRAEESGEGGTTVRMRLEAIRALCLTAEFERRKTGRLTDQAVRAAVDLMQKFSPGWFQSFPELGWVADHPLMLAQLERTQLDRRYAGVWHRNRERESQVLKGLSLSQHLEATRQLAAQGWIPTSVAAAEVVTGKPTWVATVWERPFPAPVLESFARYNEAVARLRRGELKIALEFVQQVVEQRQKHLGNDHPLTINARTQLAAAYIHRGQLTKAARLLDDTSTQLGNYSRQGPRMKDWYQARDRLLIALADEARDSGNWQAALDLFRQLGALRATYLNRNDPRQSAVEGHIAELSRILTLGESSRGAIRDALSRAKQASAFEPFAALPRFESAARQLREHLGDDHPSTYRVRRQQLNLLLNLNRLSDAQAIASDLVSSNSRHLWLDKALAMIEYATISERQNSPPSTTLVWLQLAEYRLRDVSVEDKDRYVELLDRIARLQRSELDQVWSEKNLPRMVECAKEHSENRARRHEDGSAEHKASLWVQSDYDQLAGLSPEKRQSWLDLQTLPARATLARGQDFVDELHAWEARLDACQAASVPLSWLESLLRERVAAQCDGQTPIAIESQQRRRIFELAEARLGAKHPTVERRRSDLMAALRRYAAAAVDAGQPALAVAAREEIVQHLSTLGGAEDATLVQERSLCEDDRRLAGCNASGLQTFAAAQKNLATAKRLIEGSQFAPALEQAAQASAALKTLLGDEHHLSRQSRRVMAGCYFRLNNPGRADQLLRFDLDILLRRFGPNGVATANELLNLGRVESAAKEQQRAVGRYRRAWAILRERLETNDSDRRDAAKELEAALSSAVHESIAAYQFARALLLSREHTEVLTELHGVFDWRTAAARTTTRLCEQVTQVKPEELTAVQSTLRKLDRDVGASLDADRPDDALNTVQQSLKDLESTLGPTNLLVARALVWEGVVRESLKQYHEADTAYRRARDIFLQAYEVDNEEELNARWLQSRALNYAGEREKAELLLMDTCAAARRMVGAKNALYQKYAGKLVDWLEEWAKVSEKAGDAGAAEATQTEALILAESIFDSAGERVRRMRATQEYYSRLGTFTEEQQSNAKQAQELYREAAAANTRGDMAARIVALQRAQAAYEQLYGKQSSSYAAALHTLASALSEAGRYGEAERAFADAVAIRRMVLGTASMDLAYSLRGFAAVLIDVSRPADALPLLEESREICRQAVGKDHVEYAHNLNDLGVTLHRVSRWGEAERSLEEALAAYRRIGGDKTVHEATTLSNLGNLHAARGRLPEAENRYRESLEIWRSKPQDARQVFCWPLEGLADLLVRQAHHEEAAGLLMQAWELRVKHQGAMHPESLNTAGKLAQALGILKSSDRLQAIVAQVNAHTAEAGALPLTINGNHLAWFYLQAGEKDRAIETYRATWKARQTEYGVSHALTVSTRNALATALDDRGRGRADQGEFRGAEADYREGLAIVVEALGESAFQSMNYRVLAEDMHACSELSPAGQAEIRAARALYREGIQFKQQGKYAEAVERLEQARLKFERNELMDLVVSINLQSSLGGAYTFLDRDKDALRSYSDMAAARARRYGDGHPFHATALVSLAHQHWRMGSPDAETPLLRAKAIYRAHNMTETAEMYSVELNLARVYCQLDDVARARPACTAALVGFRRLHGDLQENTLDALLLQVEIERRDGAFPEALAAGRQAVEIAERIYPPRPDNVVEAYRQLAEVQLATQQLADAERQFAEAVRRTILLSGPEAPESRSLRQRHIDVLTRISNQQFDEQNYEGAAGVAARVTELSKAMYGPEDPRCGDARQSQVRCERFRDANKEDLADILAARNSASEVRRLEAHGKNQESLDLCQKVVEVYRRVLGNEHRDTALELSFQGRLLRRVGDLGAADACISEAVEINRRVLGSRHVTTQQSMASLAVIQEKQGKLRLAVENRRAVVAASVAIWGPKSRQAMEAGDRLLAVWERQFKEASLREANTESFAEWSQKVLADARLTWGEHQHHLRALEALAADRVHRAALAPLARARWDSLVELAETLEATPIEKRSAEHVARLEGALAETKELMGEVSLERVKLLVCIAQSKFAARDWEAADRLNKEVLQVRTERLGSDNPITLATRGNAARILVAADKPELAEPHLEAVLGGLRAAGYAGGTSFLEFHEELCALYRNQKQSQLERDLVDQAVQAQRRLMEARSRDLGGADWRAREAKKELARLERLAQLSSEERELYRKALDAEKKAFAAWPADAQSALRLLRESAEAERRLFGDVAPVAERFHQLADWNHERGDPEQAAADLRVALELGAVAWSRMHPSYARSLASLAAVDQASLVEKQSMLSQAVEILRRLKGIGDYELPIAVSQLGITQMEAGKLDSARRSLYEALGLFRELDDQSPQYAACLSYVAIYHRRCGELELASNLTQAAVTVGRKFAAEHPSRFLDLVFAHQQLLQELQHWEAARVLAAEHLEFAQHHFPADYDRLAEAHYLCAEAELNCDHADNAESHLRKCFALFAESTRFSLHVSERAEAKRNADIQLALDAWLTLAGHRGLSPEVAYLPVLQWKGSAFLSQRLKRQARAHPELFPKLDELERLSSQIATLATDAIEDADRLQQQAELTRLKSRRNELDQELSKMSSAYKRSEKEQELSVDDLVRDLLPDEVFIDICQYSYRLKNRETKEAANVDRILVFVLQAGAPVRLIAFDHLETERLVQQVQQWRETVGGDELARRAAHIIKRDFWDRLQIGKARSVLISPSGSFANFPFGAMPGTTADRYLVEEVMCACIPTPRLLLEWTKARPMEIRADIELLTLGAVAYSDKSESQPDADSETRRNAIRGAGAEPFATIPGSREEANRIQLLFRQTLPDRVAVTQLYEAEASEAQFRRAAPRAHYIHLATHGFQTFQRSATRPALAANEMHTSLLPHDGLLCGVALAGANSPVSPSSPLLDDGLLTGLEVANLDLSKCRLVVLSACETGVGKSTLSEGSLSLQRAFAIAGAQSTISSLWPVYDDATRALMVEFYTKLLARPEDRRSEVLASLCEAQRELIRSYDPKTRQFARGLKLPPSDDESPLLPPVYWAGFIVSGRWR